MNETIHTLITRRSVRKYKKAQISDEDLYLILQAGTYAPAATVSSPAPSSSSRTRIPWPA